MFKRDNEYSKIKSFRFKDLIDKSKKQLKTVAVLGTYALVLSGCSKEKVDQANDYETIIVYTTKDGYEESCSSISEIEDRNDIDEILIQNLMDSSELEGIEKLKNLEAIGIYSPITNDLSPLEEAETSRMVIFDATIKNWDFLKKINGVEELTINNTNLSDTSFIENMPNLISLDLCDNFVTKIEDEKLKSLNHLYLTNNSVKTIDFSNYPSLEDTTIIGNYNLYTDENNKYFKDNGVQVDIQEDDIKYVKDIKKELSSLKIDSDGSLKNEKKVCDYVIKKMHYNNDISVDSKVLDECNEKRLKYFVEGNGICANYSDGLDACLELSGINSYSIAGYVGDISNDDFHAWNLVEIDNQYYLCDPTFSDVDPISSIYYSVTNNTTHPFINSVGKSKEFEEYIETDRYGNILVNNHVDEAKKLTSFSGKRIDIGNKLYFLIKTGILILLAGTIGKNIFRDVSREIEYRKKVKSLWEDSPSRKR